MYKIRRSSERKFFDHDWLKTYHTFSFASYYDPHFMGFRDLRVINEDRVAPGHGFPPHDHENMEIISIVLEGSLAHKDSMGNEKIIHAGEVQWMSAGTGIKHSEYNPSQTESVRFLQIWILPDKQGVTPRYGQGTLPKVINEWTLIASKEQGLQQDVKLYWLDLKKGMRIEKKLQHGWLQVIDGDLLLEDEQLRKGDGVALDADFAIQADSDTHLLLFDLK